MTNTKIQQSIKSAPKNPGIYIFKNSKNKPLYIGKALNLNNRLKSYLKTNDPRLTRMLLESVKLETIETDSEIEALILESQYIKKYRPEFNIMLRDDKQYLYVGFTGEEFPKLILTHQPNINTVKGNWKLNSANAEFLGPFTDAGALKATLRLLRKIFPYCTCKQTHNNYCLNYHIGKCPGFCCLKQQNQNLEFKILNLKMYNDNIKAIKDILSGKKSSVIDYFEKEMKKLSKEEKFEEAIELQIKVEKLKTVFKNALINQRLEVTDKTDALKELKKITKLTDSPGRIECYDIANIQGKHAVGAMVVFTDGRPDKNEYRKFKIYSKDISDDIGMLREIIERRLNHKEWPYPDLIIVDGGKAQYNLAKSLTQIPIIAITKNEFHIGHKIMIGGKEILLSKLSPETKNLLLHLDSEAHRFAISYYRSRHRKSLK